MNLKFVYVIDTYGRMKSMIDHPSIIGGKKIFKYSKIIH